MSKWKQGVSWPSFFLGVSLVFVFVAFCAPDADAHSQPWGPDPIPVTSAYSAYGTATTYPTKTITAYVNSAPKPGTVIVPPPLTPTPSTPLSTVAIAPPIVTPPPSTSTFPATIEQWRGLVAAFFDPARVDAALSVMECETDPDGDPNSDNPTSSAAGLFQFLRSTWDRVAVPLGYGNYDSGAVYDPTANVHAAAVLSDGGWNWEQWSCKP